MFKTGDMVRHVNEHFYGFIIEIGYSQLNVNGWKPEQNDNKRYYRVQWFENKDKYWSIHRWFYHREIEKVEE
jgi:hypothetical protein